MNTSAPVLIRFHSSELSEVLDAYCVRMDAMGYPVTEADLENLTLTVEVPADKGEDMVLMAAAEAALSVGLDMDDVVSAEFN